MAQLLSCLLTNDGKVVKNPIEHQHPKILGSWMFFNSLFNKLTYYVTKRKLLENFHENRWTILTTTVKHKLSHILMSIVFWLAFKDVNMLLLESWAGILLRKSFRLFVLYINLKIESGMRILV